MRWLLEDAPPAAPVAALGADADSYQAKTDAVKSLEARSMMSTNGRRYLRRGD